MFHYLFAFGLGLVFGLILGAGAMLPGEDDYDVDDYEDFAPKKLKRYGKVYEIKEDA